MVAKCCYTTGFRRVFALSVLTVTYLTYELYENIPLHKARDKPVKNILFWNTFFGKTDFYFGLGHKPFVTANCPESRCFITNNRSLIPVENWDAIIFNGIDLTHADLPTKRSAKQRYIFFMMETPSTRRIPLEQYYNFFNWTMTYRLDSDIVHPYSLISTMPDEGEVMKRTHKWRPQIPYHGPDVALKKKRLVAWFVSNCHTPSKREMLVDELSKYIPVHTFGPCGKLVCPREIAGTCMKILELNYKFYLSFENSLCKDYVTEKFFDMMRIDIVPVVFGNANYSAVAPPGSYIDVHSFQSVKELAAYLIMLDENNTLYNQHFWWKKYYTVAAGRGGDEHKHMEGFCQLCHKLHFDQSYHTYESIYDWFVSLSNCNSD